MTSGLLNFYCPLPDQIKRKKNSNKYFITVSTLFSVINYILHLAIKTLFSEVSLNSTLVSSSHLRKDAGFKQT